MQVIINALQIASGLQGNKNSACNIFTNGCKWSYFLQWSAWNVVLVMQLVLTHAASVWTDKEGHTSRRLLMQRASWRTEQHKSALILEAPWMVHLPKLGIWLFMQATLVVQLVDALSGHAYSQHQVTDCLQAQPSCKQTDVFRVMNILRMVILGLYFVWHIMLLRHGWRDMQSTPYQAFRLGRMLMQLRMSGDMGLSQGGLLFIGLLVDTARRGFLCFSCLHGWLQLATSLQATSMGFALAVLFQPMADSGRQTVMQVWLQKFAWTEQSSQPMVQQRNDLIKHSDRAILAKEPMFCFETAIKLLYWCTLAYEYDEINVSSQLSEAKAMQLFNLQQMRLVREPVTGTKCLVAWGDNSLVISFRGTANLQNAKGDLQAWLVKFNAGVDVEQAAMAAQPSGKQPNDRAAVHAGFQACWQSKLKTDLCELIEELLHASPAKAACTTVYITGHSLGGAMAILAAYDIAGLGLWRSMRVYTFGAPRPGNRAFARLYDNKVPDTWHIMNYRDPVPIVGKFWMMYARPGHRVLVTPKGDMLVRPSPLEIKMAQACGQVKAHYLLAYRASVLQVIKMQLERSRYEDGLEGVLDLANSIDLTDILFAEDIDVDLRAVQLGEKVIDRINKVASAITPDAFHV